MPFFTPLWLLLQILNAPLPTPFLSGFANCNKKALTCQIFLVRAFFALFDLYHGKGDWEGFNPFLGRLKLS